MARKVFVSSDMSVDEALMEISEQDPLAPLLWPWFLTAFDDWGRAEAAPIRIKAKIFPLFGMVTVQVINDAILCFSSHGLVETYESDSKKYMAVPPDKWFKYQTHIHGSKRTRDESKFPAPPSWDAYQKALDNAEPRGDDAPKDPPAREIAEPRDGAREIAGNHTPTRVSSPSPSPTLSKERVGEEEYREEASPPPAPQQVLPITKTRFVKPTEQEAKDYCAEKGFPQCGEAFWTYWESRGWPGIADWRMAARNWYSKEKPNPAARGSPSVHPMKAGLGQAAEYEANRIRQKTGRAT